MTYRVIGVIAYLLLAPFVGGLLNGLDRKISAKMQGRIGPSIFQPFYDVIKLLSKQFIIVNRAQIFLVISFLLTVVLTGCMFFGGSDIPRTFVQCNAKRWYKVCDYRIQFNIRYRSYCEFV